MLSIGGRFKLVKSVLGSLGIYYFSLFKIPVLITNQLEVYEVQVFWGCKGVETYYALD